MNAGKVIRKKGFRRDRPLSKQAAVLFLAGPIAFILLSLTAVFFFRGIKAVSFIVGMAVVSVLTGAGKFVILGSIAPDAPIGPLGLALLVVAMDTTAAFMLIPVMPLIYRAPYIGKFLCRIRQASRQVLNNNAWMNRFTFLGLLTYVAVPFGGTGAVGAVFLGRLLGLRRIPVILGTLLGATIGASMLLVLASFGRQSFDTLRNNTYLTYSLGISIGLALLAFAWRVIVAMRANKNHKCPKDDNFDDDDDPEQVNAEHEDTMSPSQNQRVELHLVIDQEKPEQDDDFQDTSHAPQSKVSP